MGEDICGLIWQNEFIQFLKSILQVGERLVDEFGREYSQPARQLYEKGIGVVAPGVISSLLFTAACPMRAKNFGDR